MNVTIVSDDGSETDTEVERFWYDRGDLVVRYEDESELRYPHGEAVAAAPDGENPNIPDPRAV
jgi:hypothetical protein